MRERWDVIWTDYEDRALLAICDTEAEAKALVERLTPKDQPNDYRGAGVYAERPEPKEAPGPSAKWFICRTWDRSARVWRNDIFAYCPTGEDQFIAPDAKELATEYPTWYGYVFAPTKAEALATLDRHFSADFKRAYQ